MGKTALGQVIIGRHEKKSLIRIDCVPRIDQISEN